LTQLRQAAQNAQAAANGAKTTSPISDATSGSFALGAHSITLTAASAGTAVQIDGAALSGKDLFTHEGEQYIFRCRSMPKPG